MQLYSLVVTLDGPREGRTGTVPLQSGHGHRGPLRGDGLAPDVHRFSKWCEQRDAEPRRLRQLRMVSQRRHRCPARRRESGACRRSARAGRLLFLGTTLYTARDICRILHLPKGVIPLTTVVIGHPAEQPAPDRPPSARRRSALRPLQGLHRRRDRRTVGRKGGFRPRPAALLAEKRTAQSGADLHAATANRRDGRTIAVSSRAYFELLREQGFFNQ